MVRAYVTCIFTGVIALFGAMRLECKNSSITKDGIKVEFFDYVKSPQEPVAWLSSSFKARANYFTCCDILPFLIQVTNSGSEPIMINSRSVTSPVISVKKAVTRLKRAHSFTGWPYLESWLVYAAWIPVSGFIGDRYTGLCDLTQYDSIKKYVSFKIPKAPEKLKEVGLQIDTKIRAFLQHKLSTKNAANCLDAYGYLVRYLQTRFDRILPLKVCSLLAWWMSGMYLAKIYRKDKQVDDIGVLISGNGLRLQYPLVIHPGQTAQKLVLIDQKALQKQAVSFDVYTYNNQDILHSFEYCFDGKSAHPETPVNEVPEQHGQGAVS